MAYPLQPITVTAGVTLTKDTHAGTVVVHNSADGGTITLPASSGKGDKYTVFVLTTVTTDLVIEVANATDEFRGGVSISSDIAGVTFLAADNDDTLTMNGSTTGGVTGSWVSFTDVSSGIWMVNGFLCSSGSEADCFSAAVS